MRHTPGPWKSELVPTSVGSAYKFPPTNACLYIDSMPLYAKDDLAHAEQHANARLIAAAPDFYEAAKGILAAFECKAFVRNTLLDHESDWAIKAFPHLQALAKLAQAIEKVDATPVVEAKAS